MECASALALTSAVAASPTLAVSAAARDRAEPPTPMLSVGRGSVAPFLLPRFKLKYEICISVPLGLGSVSEASGLKYFCSKELQVQIPEGFLLGLASF